MLNYQLPIVETYTYTTREVQQYTDWDYEKIEAYLDTMKKRLHVRS